MISLRSPYFSRRTSVYGVGLNDQADRQTFRSYDANEGDVDPYRLTGDR